MTFWTERLDLLVAGTADVPPVTETLKMGLVDEWGPGWVRKRWAPRPELMGTGGTLFGGYLAALADQILTFAAMTVMPDGVAFRTVNLQVQFVKIGRAHPLLIAGRVTANSKRLVTVDADFRRDDGELIARANAQQMVLPQEHG